MTRLRQMIDGVELLDLMAPDHALVVRHRFLVVTVEGLLAACVRYDYLFGAQQLGVSVNG